MSESKIPSGPWALGDIEDGDGEEVEGRAMVYAGHHCDIEIQGDGARAVAVLIAVAPDLLGYAKLMAANGDPDAIELVAKAEGAP